jgi:hypothetical protein
MISVELSEFDLMLLFQAHDLGLHFCLQLRVLLLQVRLQ